MVGYTESEKQEGNLYIEKISSILRVGPEIGILFYILEWYLVYAISYQISGSWMLGTKEFGVVDVIPFTLALIVGWGSIYIKRSYIAKSKELEFLLTDSASREIRTKMIRKNITRITYVILAFAAALAAINSFIQPDGIAQLYGFGGKIFMAHDLIWYLIVGIPALSEMVSLLFGVMVFPYLVSRGIKEESINPIEPYRCGGLRPVGELCFSTGFVYFLGLALYTVLFYNVRFISAIVYFMWIGGIIMFLAPQYKVKEILGRYKINMLNSIKSKINENNKIRNIVTDKVTGENAMSLFVLLNLFNEVEKMNEYPFDLKILGEFLAVAGIPLIINIISGFLLDGI